MLDANGSALGVVIVTYNGADVIGPCLDSLAAAHSVNLKVIVVDNASGDGTVEAVSDWINARAEPSARGNPTFESGTTKNQGRITDTERGLDMTVALTVSPSNKGFAGGVNIGLGVLENDRSVDRFWILNPDCVADPATPARLAGFHPADGRLGMVGGRIVYAQPPHRIQIDGGTIDWVTGMTGNINKDLLPAEAKIPADADLDFISGASVMVSREFLEHAGPMPEDYFLYYEEVDWALRRGDLPLHYCEGAVVHHQAGSSIGSPTQTKMASPLSIYFKLRSRQMFLKRHSRRSLPANYAHGLAKAVHTFAKGYPVQAGAALRAIHGMPPSRQILAALGNAD